MDDDVEVDGLAGVGPDLAADTEAQAGAFTRFDS
jgi:hypothetical protein